MSTASSSEIYSPGLAAALSFIFPGVGHIYIGSVGKGIGFLIGTIIGYALFVVPGLIAHFFAILVAYQDAKDVNHDASKEGHVNGESGVNSANGTTPSTIKTADIVERLEKLGKLHAHDILTQEEFEAKKGQVISDIARRKLDKPPEDFLFDIKDLKDHVLDTKDIKKIKSRVL